MNEKETIVVKIEDKEFILSSDSIINIFSDSGENFIQYNGDLFSLSGSYDIPSKINNQSVISLKKSERPIVTVAVHQKSDYSILYENANYSINSGDYSDINFHHKGDSILKLYKNKDDITDKNLTIRLSIDTLEHSVSNTDENDIRSQINNVYSNNSSINTHQTENTTEESNNNKYYTDLEIISQANKLDNLEFIDEGSYRDVYKIKDKDKFKIQIDYPDDVVIKIAKRNEGITDNKREYQTWQAVKGTNLEKHFCPIVNRGPDFKYIIMKEAGESLYNKSIHGYNTEEIENEIRNKILNSIRLENELGDYGFDIHDKNICKDPNTGEYILVDYPYGANFEYIS